ncbi:MAG: hypothetical protein C4519_28750 [Desulfobacteraceae bacterium]|nr:MAG: hypothetical protein C4519_28750 [Desulfobacteraceae bacterium]
MIAPWKKYRLGFWGNVFCLFTASICFGAQCLSLSPTLRGAKNAYAPITVRELTPGEQEGLGRLFRSLAGTWQGRADSFFCRSAEDPADVENDQEIMHAKVSVDYYGNWYMSADFYSAGKKAGRQEMLTLYQNNRKLRIDHDTGVGDVELIEVSDTTIAFLYRRFLSIGRSGSSRREHFFTLKAAGGSFTIEQLLYIQGKLSSGQTWRFERG